MPRRLAPVMLAAVAMLLVTGTARAQGAACALTPAGVAPDITLAAGENYFREGGVQSLLLGRNPTGWDTDGSAAVNTQHFDELFGYAMADGERLVRIQIVTGARPNPALAGDVDCNWVAFWDEVFTRAASSGLHVLPVFGVHAQWRAALPNWATNEYNSAYRTSCVDGTTDCLAATPTDLFDVTTPGGTGLTYIAWVRQLVARWKDRPNIVGWEIFSEIDLVDGATDAAAAAFIEAARSEIRAEDPTRPVTASLSGTIDYPLVNSTSIDFLQLHLYSSTFGPGDLDEMILTFVPQRRLAYPAKPLLIGESGLHYLAPSDPGNPYTLAEPGARTAINQAIWAGAVSGAMNARSLWWEDGYDRFHIADLCVYAQYAAYAECSDGDATTVLTLRALYAYAAQPVAQFVAGVDYAGFAQITLTGSANVYGAALGNANMVLGWVKDAASIQANNWTTTTSLVGETVTLDVPGTSADWLVDFYDTDDPTGTIVSTIDADQDAAGDITFALPTFTGSIAFKVYPVAPLAVDIDIVPSGSQNRINISTPGTIPVAILRTPAFDPTTIDPSTVRFGPGGASPRSGALVDVDGDTDLDLRLRFRKIDAGFSCGDTEGVLTGETVTGRSFVGSDAVTIRAIPPC